jgi:O-antigen/teichoic acid export membrane protein
MGSLTQVYLATHNKNQYVNYFAIAGLIVDVILNAALIPVWGTMGAAAATLVTYIVIHIVMPMVFQETREVAKIMWEAMLFRYVLDDDLKEMIRKKMKRK